MSSKLYVGNISFQTSEQDLEDLFGQHGQVKSAKIIMDRETGRSRGFGFVEMETPDQANEAIEKLDGQEHGGRNLKVNLAREKTDRGGDRDGGRGGFRGRR